VTVIKKIDVQNHRATHNRNGRHLYRPVSQPDATGFSGEQSGRAESRTGDVVREPLHQPFSAGLETPLTRTNPDSGRVATPTDSKSARA
jgi:hypothetical protein